MKKSNYLFPIIASLIVSPVLTMSAHAKVTTVTLSLVCDNSELPGWQGIVNAFNKQSTDIKVKLEVIPGSWGEYLQQMLVRSVAGKAPDIGRMGVALMPHFMNRNLLEDLMPYVKSTKYKLDAYYRQPFNMYTKGQSLYGIPAGIYSMASFYNRSMFKAAGLQFPTLDWDKAWTWEQYRAAAKKLTKASAKQWGTFVNMNPERSLPYVWQNGGDIFNEARTKCTLDSPASVEAFRYLYELIWKDQVAPAGWEDFTQGKLGIFQDGQWAMPYMSNIKKFEWGVCPLPRGKEGAATVIYPDPWVIYKGSKHKKEAWKVIKFFTEQEAENILVDKELMGIPILKKVAENRRNTMFKPLPTEEKKVWLDSVEYARTVPFTTTWTDMMNLLMPRLDKVTGNRMSVEDALKASSADITKILQRKK